MMLICYYTAVGMMMKSVIDKMTLYHQLTALITKINDH
ncbi:hypothetical protein AO377_1843 [Moraxella catarrhalis]|nr:hypothetical protein AO377_1843 [Moraxella catarrhalis]OAV14208.1 hypothetical protein AO375_1323 [Moraxella catarrhalis]OAV34269.1 hypothetical protein AO365_1489 [Moraxella catarrhalis]